MPFYLNLFSKILKPSVPVSKAKNIGSSVTGTVFTVSRLLGSSSTLSLITGSNSNLTINSTTGVISATSPLGIDVVQRAILREVHGYNAFEYPVDITGKDDGINPYTVDTEDGNSTIFGNAITGFTALADDLNSILSANGKSVVTNYARQSKLILDDFDAIIAAIENPPVVKPTITLSADVTKAEGNSGTTVYTYTATRSTTTGSLTASWSFTAGTTSADDFVGGTYPTGGTLAFGDGVASVQFTVNVAGDATVEPDESFTVAIVANAAYTLGSPNSATGGITNDDAAPANNTINHGTLSNDAPYRDLGADGVFVEWDVPASDLYPVYAAARSKSINTTPLFGFDAATRKWKLAQFTDGAFLHRLDGDIPGSITAPYRVRVETFPTNQWYIKVNGVVVVGGADPATNTGNLDALYDPAVYFGTGFRFFGQWQISSTTYTNVTTGTL